MSLRLGLLSTARINHAILTAAAASEEVEVGAVASRQRERAEAYARERGIARAHGSYGALVADPEIDAIYVSLPNALHTEWAIRALEAGKHVLSEKPLDRRPEEVERSFDVAKKRGLVLMEGLMWRHHPQTRELDELVGSGAIGELRLVRASFSSILEDPEDVRMDPGLDGGALMDLGCYCISGIRLLAGEPGVVSGRQVVGPSSVDIRFAGVLEHPGRVLAQFDCAFDAPLASALEAIGSDGTASVASPWLCREPGIELRRGDEIERIEVEDDDRYRLQLENFAAAVRGEREPLLGREDAIGQARAIEGLYRSAETGTAVRL